MASSSGDGQYSVAYHNVAGDNASAADHRSSSGEGAAATDGGATDRSSIVEVRDGLESAVNSMRDNIRAITSRGENMETLLCKSESFGGLAQNFTRQTRAFERSEWVQQNKVALIASAVIVCSLCLTFFMSRSIFYSAVFSLSVVTCMWGYRQLELQNRLQNPSVPREIAMTRV